MAIPIVDGILGIINKIIPDPKLKTELTKHLKDNESAIKIGFLDLFAKMNKGQLDINLADAKSGKWWQAGWRPFIGWVCGLALAYHFIIHPLFNWVAVLLGLPQNQLPPDLDITALYPLMLTILGAQGIRSIDKYNLIDKIKSKKK